MLYALGNERKVQYRKKTVVKNVAHSPPQDSQEVFFMDTFFDPFCFELAWENWAKSFLSHSVCGHDLDHTHSLARFRWSGLTNQQTLNCMPEMVVPTMGENSEKWFFYAQLYTSKERNGSVSANQAMLWLCWLISPSFLLLQQNKLCQLIICRRFQWLNNVVT